jgi:hypothetical protein
MFTMKKAFVFLAAALLTCAVLGVAGAGGNSDQVQLERITKGEVVTVNRGARLAYSYRLWASVGYGADYVISNLHVLKMVYDKALYLHGDRMKPGMTGGDEARAQYVFKAVDAGSTLLTVRELYRGKVKVEKRFEVEAKDSKLLVKCIFLEEKPIEGEGSN